MKNINKTKQVRKIEKRLRRLQRSVSRKYEMNREGDRYAKTSNCIKIEKRIQHLHRRLTNIRTNHIHQATNAIAKTKPCKVVMEDLNVKGMMKNRHLSKAIQQQKFKEFSRQMEYKCEKYGIEFMKGPRLSMQMWIKTRSGFECGIEFAEGRAISSLITNKILLMCRIRCIRIYACGVSHQMQVASAKAGTMKQEANKAYRFL